MNDDQTKRLPPSSRRYSSKSTPYHRSFPRRPMRRSPGAASTLSSLSCLAIPPEHQAESVAVARGPDAPIRAVTLSSGELSIDIQILADGPPRTVLGQLSPAASATIEIQTGDGESARPKAIAADASGHSSPLERESACAFATSSARPHLWSRPAGSPSADSSGGPIAWIRAQAQSVARAAPCNALANSDTRARSGKQGRHAEELQ